MSRSSSHTEQCGICSSVSLLFRRIMCIGATSRRGSDESYYYHHQHPHQTSGTAGVQETLLIERDIQVLVDSGGPAQSTISLHVPDSQEGCCLLVSRNVTQSEWALIDSHSTSIIPKTGRFLTMHKRRRKRLTTRSLCQDPALLDDIHHGQVECVLERVWKWPFNAFTLDNATGGRSLPVLCVHLFHWYGLMEHFNLDVVRVWKLFSLIEEGYHGTNPYHNSIHATDVTQAMHCFLQEEKIKRHLTHLEIMASLLAAVAHDLDHPGVNQPFLIATSNHLAALYENTSVLENHHWRSAVGCLLESNVAEQLGSIRPELERQISSLILATDITRQQEFLTRFKEYLDSKTLDMSQAEHRHFILQIALKCADISNPCRPWDVSKKWSQKVCEEFFRQGDYERQLNLPVTSLCDRYSTSIPKIQTGFFKFVVFPLFEEWHRFLCTPLSTSMMGHLRGNQAKWDAMLATELAEETKTEISDAEEVNLEDCVDLDRRASLPAVMLETVDRMGRRHSVPINFAGNEINVPVLGGGRRDSLPASAVVERGARRFAGVQERHLEEEEEDEDDAYNMSSLRSSCSSGIQKSSECGSGDDRPVSAENLLPEPSIASITTHDEASRLSSVLHGSSCLTLPANRMLTRQQTFPPLQPYVRQRYMSTTGQELGNPAQLSGGSTSSADTSSDSISPVPPPGGSGGSNSSVAPPSGGSTSPVPVVLSSGSSTSINTPRIKRDASGETTSTGFPSKVARMWREKENVAPPSSPRASDLLVSEPPLPLVKRNSLTIPQVSTRRRGSAPVGQDSILKNLIERQSRRGSVPSEVSIKPPSSTNSQSQQQCSVLNTLDSNGSLGLPRRSSLPYDLVKHSLSPTSIGYSGERRSSDGGGVTRGSKRRMNKLLKRRSSGGPDLILAPNNSPASTLTPRRGSLPLEVIASSLYSSGTP